MAGSISWEQLRRRIEALDAQRQAAFALACAERLVAVEGTSRGPELRGALQHGWSGLSGSSGDLESLRAGLEDRADADDDEVAAVCYALGAVMGRPGEAWWVASRARDAADERDAYPPTEPSSSPAGEDAAEMKRELDWQSDTVAVLAGNAELSTVLVELRS